MFRTSPNGRKLITQFEGEILHGYLDPIKIPTIGVGHVILPGEPYRVGKKITQAESQLLLANDLKQFEEAVNRLVKVPINQNQFDALVSFAFNIGIANLQNSGVLRSLNAKQYQQAAEKLLNWNKAGGKVLPGLTSRRKRERDLFLTQVSTVATPSATTSEADLTPPPDTKPAVRPLNTNHKLGGGAGIGMFLYALTTQNWQMLLSVVIIAAVIGYFVFRKRW